MRKQILELTREASLETVRELRHILENALKACKLEEEERSKITLCFSESATNSVEHGSSVKNIFLSLFSDSYGYWIETKDDGTPYTPHISVKPNSIPAFDNSAEGGRGTFILSSLAERIELSETSRDEDFVEGQPHWTNGLRMGWAHEVSDTRPAILIVEDDPALTKLYEVYLGDEFQVLTAPDGASALVKIERQNISLVISDINMPNMNGIEFRKRLSQDPTNEITPFIFLTNTEDHEVIDLANQMGIDDYIRKPIAKQPLLDKIHRVLTRSKHLKQRLTERIDQDIISALIPTLPNPIGNIATALASRNTGHGGGDLILHHKKAQSDLIILIDVMGHNETSKFFSHAYAGYLRGLIAALDTSATPSTILEHLSQGIYDDNLLSKLTLTCCVMEINESNIVEIATAGHPSPILFTETGANTLPVKGILPGLIRHCSYSSYIFKLTEGTRLALYTDGLLESAATNEARQKLEQSIIESLKNDLEEDMDHSLNRCMQIFDTRNKEQPTDDALLLLLEPQQK